MLFASILQTPILSCSTSRKHNTIAFGYKQTCYATFLDGRQQTFIEECIKKDMI